MKGKNPKTEKMKAALMLKKAKGAGPAASKPKPKRSRL